ncbi:MAG: hypothetical protein ACR5LF_04035 [Symbiopectobacterium sp.]
MKYLASFHTTLKISRYLFRLLAIMLWMLGVLISIFYFSKVLNDKEAELRLEYNQSYDQSQEYIRRTTDIVRELRYVAWPSVMSTWRPHTPTPSSCARRCTGLLVIWICSVSKACPKMLID